MQEKGFTISLGVGAYDSYAFVVSRDIAVPVLQDVSVIQRRRKYPEYFRPVVSFSDSVQCYEALRGGRGRLKRLRRRALRLAVLAGRRLAAPVVSQSRGAVEVVLVVQAVGGVVLRVSRRVIRRSSSSPNSPPIRVGRTTITS
ncbi:hypothetical protein F7725_010532 [Dissostichus mawsoni]|uniref:Uncharacterized protein n=1 Tax=Dissostichus mawsoni TaxID=36200 RepID=A0A7J5XNW8_DISMA|nr:hypothetical protein F7725_010532 [Dissostichus mawsoni]